MAIPSARFARSTSYLLKSLKTFKEKNTRFISITESIDTNSPLGVALYTILGALAQLEREMIIERVHAGMADTSNQTLDELKRMDLSPETVHNVEQDLETAAKAKVMEIQGQYYETYDSAGSELFSRD